MPKRTSQVVLVLKNLPSNTGYTREESLIPGLGRSPLVENEIHSSILAWKIQWTEEPGGLQSMGYQKWTHTNTHTPKNKTKQKHLVGFKGGESWPRLQPSLSVGGSRRSRSYNRKRKRNKSLVRWCCWSKQKTHWVINTVQILTQHHTVSPCWLSILYIVVHVYSSQWK